MSPEAKDVLRRLLDATRGDVGRALESACEELVRSWGERFVLVSAGFERRPPEPVKNVGPIKK